MAYNPQNPNGQAARTASAPVVLATEQEAEIGAVTETAPGSDTASSGLNGRLQRIAQRLTSLIALFPTAIGQTTKTGSLSVAIASDQTVPISAASLPLPSGAATETTLSTINGKLVTAKTADYDTGAGTDTVEMVGIALPKSGGAVAGGTSTDPVRIDPTGTTTQPVSVASVPLPAGAATEATLATRLSESDFDTKTGSLTETAPATDTASSGLNGRLQRIAQRLTSIIALLPTALGAGGGLKVDGSGTALPISAASLPLPTGAATETTLSALNTKVATAKTADFDTGAGTDTVQMIGIALPKSGGAVVGGTSTDPVRTDPTGTTTQPVSVASLPLPSGAATESTLATRLSESDFDTKTGSLTETAPATDTASSGLNGRLQRIAQRLTSIIALLPTALGAGGGLKVDGSGTALPISAASLPLPSGAATETTLGTRLSESDFDTKIGSLTETAPATDTASSGLNGRLQRIAQRLTTLIAGITQGTAAAGTAGWPGVLGNIARSATSWTSATALDSTAALTVTNYGVCLVTVNTPSTLTAGGIIFEASDDAGTTWFSIAAARVESATIETSFTLTASLKRAWAIPCAGFTNVRVRLNPVITGAGTTTVALLGAAIATTMQPVAVASLPLPSGAATETTLGTRLSESDFDTKVGSLTETAPATDTASSGLNGRLQRIAQRLTSIIALLPAALGSGGGLKVDGSGTALPVSIADGSSVTLGSKTDAKSTATDGTSITIMQVLKQISASVQSLVTGTVLAAGTALIGKVGIDQTTPGTTNAISIAQVANTTVVNGGVAGSLGVGGNTAHDGVNAGNPDYAGAEAIAHGTNPTAVSAGDRTKLYANRAGIPFVIGGHPNIVTTEFHFTAAQTNVKLVTVSSGTKIVVTKISALLGAAATVNVGVRVGLAQTTLTAVSSSGVSGMVLSHSTLAPGSGVVEGNGSGIIAIGADGDDLIITCDAPTSSSLRILVTYYTIES